MTSMTEDSPRGDGSSPPPPYLAPTSPSMQPATSSLAPGVPSLPPDLLPRRVGNMVYKSGYLLLSSKGIGWTSWKKRWFILTSTSLVFLKTDPSAASKGNELNLTLGSIDLNSSGSVVIKDEKKLLTLVFPSGRDACSFNLKAETLEDLHEWKTALESALAEAPTGVVKNGSFKNVQTDVEHVCDDQPPKALLNSGTILLALEDSDGTPSFLEKALCFIEEFGVKVEGILRQAADVDDVERRIRDYEQGNRDFSPDEDPHVVSDCFKYVLREFPSSPLPAACCKALLEACRGDLSGRVDAIRTIICGTLPEPNQRLLKRILGMMETVASHKAVNRMSSSAVAACMAPLLLRPLLAGECELENDFDVGGDGSVQLLQAAAAANHAQAIVITLLEDYNNIFWEGSMSSGTYTDSLSESGDEDQSEDGSFEEEDDVKGDSDESCTGMADKRDKVIEVKERAEEIVRSSAALSRHDLNNLKVVCSIKDGELPVTRMATNKERTSTGVQEKLPVTETQCVEDDNINNNSQNMIVTGESVHERNVQLRVQRVALEKEVARLQEELERERRLRMKLEAALRPSHVGDDQ